MKLKNKLLPLVGVAAVCATAAPIALTSCKTNNDWFDLMEKYNSTVKALDYTSFTTEQANEAYFGKEGSWKSDNEVINTFIDDSLFSISKDNSRGYTEAKVKMYDFYVNHPTYTPNTGYGDPYQVPTFTFKVEYQGTYTSKGSKAESTTTYSVVQTIVNLPVHVFYDTDVKQPEADDPYWYVEADLPFIMINESDTYTKSPIAWSIYETINYTKTTVDTETGYEATVTDSSTKSCYNGYDNSIIDFFEEDLEIRIKSISHYLFSVQNID